MSISRDRGVTRLTNVEGKGVDADRGSELHVGLPAMQIGYMDSHCKCEAYQAAWSYVSTVPTWSRRLRSRESAGRK